MQAIALGLESKNPFAYLLLFVILYPPIMAILFAVIDRFKKWRTAMQDLIREPAVIESLWLWKLG